MSSSNDQQLVKFDQKDAAEIEKLKLQLVLNSNTNNGPGAKRKRKVLDEDEYTDKIDSIIERDFFPDVSKLRFELSYHDAVEKNDFELIEKLNKQKREMLNREQPRQNVPDTPATFESPLNPPERATEEPPDQNPTEAIEPSDSKKLSLNSFLNKYTSEDNESFEQLQEQAYQKHLDRINFLSKGKEEHNMKVEAAMILPSGEEQQMLKCGKQIADECKLISWKYSDKNTVMFEPEGAALTVKEKEDLKQREVIVHENTRFKQNPFVSMKKPDLRLMKTQGLLKTGKVGVDGKEVNSSATPSVNGFKFVPSTPSLNPDAVPDSPLMTWGEIEATPLNIRGDMTPSIRPDMTPTTHFRIPEVPQREIAGQELANRILTNKKRPQHKTLNSKQDGSFVSSIERLNSMSPAARLLATKKLGVNNNFDQSLQASYSPSPRHSLIIRTPTPRKLVTPSPVAKLTPSAPKSTKSSASKPKRAKADDFF